jgi:hypothetical protein
MNDGLSTTMLTSRVMGGLSFVSVFTTFTSTNTMNNVLPNVIFANEESCPSMIGSMPSFHNQGSYVTQHNTTQHLAMSSTTFKIFLLTSIMLLI